MDTELETGTYARTGPRRRHNGYWAGDFREAAPMPWAELRRVMEVARPTGVGTGW